MGVEHVVWFQKVPILQPQSIIENSEEEGGLKGQFF